MYSVVLMAALTTGGNAPDWNVFHCGCGPYSGQAYGCTGCLGCSGGVQYGCYGSGYGTVPYGYYGSVSPYSFNYACYGCHGCYGCGGFYGCNGISPVGVGGGPGGAPEVIPPPRIDNSRQESRKTEAKVIVQIPTDAKLFVDGNPVKINGEQQTFRTPALERGQTYYYEVRAEVVRDGKTVTESKRVLVRAGEDARVSFPLIDATPPVVASVDPKR